METANEIHCSDYFLLDVARFFMSSIWPSSISDCNLSPPPLDFDVMDKKLLFYFIFSSGLFGSCVPAINSC